MSSPRAEWNQVTKDEGVGVVVGRPAAGSTPAVKERESEVHLVLRGRDELATNGLVWDHKEKQAQTKESDTVARAKDVERVAYIEAKNVGRVKVVGGRSRADAGCNEDRPPRPRIETERSDPIARSSGVAYAQERYPTKEADQVDRCEQEQRPRADQKRIQEREWAVSNQASTEGGDESAHSTKRARSNTSPSCRGEN